jgi:hypothetical protein
MPSQVIRKVNRIGQQEKQGGEFHFLNLSKEPYEWTDTVQEGDPEFQGLLEEEAPFPEMSAELPGVPLKEDPSGDQRTSPRLQSSCSGSIRECRNQHKSFSACRVRCR